MKLSELLKNNEGPDTTGTPKARVTVFKNARDLVPVADITLAEMLTGIRDGRHREAVEAVRAEPDPKEASALKTRLPAVTLSCTMASRAKDAPERVTGHSGWLQADIDGKENAGHDQAAMRAALIADPHVGAVFVGPSGKGMKAVVRIPPDIERHGQAFDSARRYFAEKHGLTLDKACRDVTRLCFLSWDPDAWLRDGETAVLPVTAAPPTLFTAPAAPAEPLGEIPMSVEDVREMLTFIPPKPDYDKWLRICSAVWSVLPMAQGIQVLNEWSPEEGSGYADKWKARLMQIKVGTLVHYAKEGGFDSRQASRRKLWIGKRLVSGGTRGPAGQAAPVTAVEADPGRPLNAKEELDEERKEWLWAQFNRQQIGEAEIFADVAGERCSWDPVIGKWRNFDTASGLWTADLVKETAVLVSNVVAGEYEKLIEAIEASLKVVPLAGKGDTRVDDIKALRRRINSLRKLTYCNAIATFAQSLPGMARPVTDYDRNPDLLAVRNGVLDLAEGHCRPARPEDLLTLAADVEFVQEEPCPRFDAFLHRAFGGDVDLIDFWWRILGYSLTGHVDHDLLFFNYGSGSNGKSTAILAVSAVLGKQIAAAAKAQLLLGENPVIGADYQLAALDGKRAIFLDELPANKAMNAAMVKTLLSGEPVVARQIYEAARTITPTWKIFMTGNHKPTIADTDLGIWRRICLIPWLNTVPENERRPRSEILAEFAEEKSGILWRMLLGLDDFIARGRRLDPPEAVMNATESYRDEENQVQQFVDEQIVQAPGAYGTTTISVWQRYERWCDENGVKPAIRSSNKLTRELQKPPFSLETARGTGNKMVFLNACLVKEGD